MLNHAKKKIHCKLDKNHLLSAQKKIKKTHTHTHMAYNITSKQPFLLPKPTHNIYKTAKAIFPSLPPPLPLPKRTESESKQRKNLCSLLFRPFIFDNFLFPLSPVSGNTIQKKYKKKYKTIFVSIVPATMPWTFFLSLFFFRLHNKKQWIKKRGEGEKVGILLQKQKNKNKRTKLTHPNTLARSDSRRLVFFFSFF